MEIVIGRPPNYDQIAAVFPLARFPHAIFCYGETVYNPGGGKITPALFAHESVHSQRQGSAAELWWKFYLEDPAFRLREEIPAHIAEYRYFCLTEGHGRNQRRAYLSMAAQRLSSPLYGSLISAQRARELIRTADA